MSSNRQQQIQIVIPDAGPLISLARAGALDLLLLFKDEVRLVITDFVEFEVTRNRDRFKDAEIISDFFTKHAGKLEIRETSFGKPMKQAALLRERYEEDPIFRKTLDQAGISPQQIPNNVGELSIVSFISEMIENPPGVPLLVLAEDEFFLHGGSTTPGNAHVLSTKAFLSSLKALGLTKDAGAIWKEIQAKRPTISKLAVDRGASKLSTDWKRAIDPRKVEDFKARRKSPKR